MPQHRDPSKSEELEGRSGAVDPGSTPRTTQASPEGGHPRVDGRGLAPVGTAAGPAEERTFSQGGGSTSQPSGTKRMATDESEDAGHLDRADITTHVVESGARDRGRGAATHGAKPPRA